MEVHEIVLQFIRLVAPYVWDEVGFLDLDSVCRELLYMEKERLVDESESLQTILDHCVENSRKKRLAKRERDIRAYVSVNEKANYDVRFQCVGRNSVEKKMEDEIGVPIAPTTSTTKAEKRPSFLQSMSNMFKSSSQDSSGKEDYEEVTDLDIINASILDICGVPKGEVVPEGYYRISKTLSGQKANLNMNSGGTPLFLCMRKDSHRRKQYTQNDHSMNPIEDSTTGGGSGSNDSVPICAFTILYPDRGEYLPAGFNVMRKGLSREPCNLNMGNSGERIYLCYKRDRYCAPITDMQIILPGYNETCPRGFVCLEQSMSMVSANFNSGTIGQKIFLTYKQEPRLTHCLWQDGTEDFPELNSL